MATHGFPTGLSDLMLRPLTPSTTIAETATLSAQETTSPWERLQLNVQYSVSRALWPEWARSAFDRLFALLDLRPNWDSYGGRSIDVKAADKAMSLLLELMNDRSPAPTIVPTPVGGVQLEWHQRGIDLEIEVLPAGPPTVFARNAHTGSKWEDELPSALTRIREAIAQISC